MKFKVLLLAATAVVAPQVARAADIPVPVHKSPAVVAAPGLSWTGFYVNGGIGYGQWSAEQTTTGLPGFGEPALPVRQWQGGRGWLGRVGGGFDYQFAPR